MTRVYTCPVDGCSETMQNVDSIISHVAGKAQYDEAHEQQRDSDDHRRFWYQHQCVDKRQMRFSSRTNR